MKSRDELEKEIIEKMKSMREEIRDAADGGDPENAGTSTSDSDGDSVPYDKDAARSVIQKFIENHPDKNRFVSELKSRMDESEKTPGD